MREVCPALGLTSVSDARLGVGEAAEAVALLLSLPTGPAERRLVPGILLLLLDRQPLSVL